MKIDISMTTINKNIKNTKIEILRDPDFALKSKHQHLKLWCMANKIYKNKKNLYVCFEVNRKNIFNLSFCIVIVNAPKNNQCFDEMARKYFQNVSFTCYFTPRKFCWN